MGLWGDSGVILSKIVTSDMLVVYYLAQQCNVVNLGHIER